MLKYIDQNKLRPEAVVLTHAHADHIAGIPLVRSRYPDIPVYLARVEWSFLGDPRQNLSGLFGPGFGVEASDLRDLAEGQALELGVLRWRVLDTSGHSPGGRTLYCAAQSVAIVGDSLFAGSIGRTDFPHSDGPLLLRNIRTKLLTLPGATRVLSGHGPDTTIAEESASNPFVGRIRS